MAQSAGSTMRDMVMAATRLYPAAVRSGAAYWSEMVASSSSYYADVMEALMKAASDPRRSGDALGEALERLRDYIQRYGDTVERAILDFNQALMVVGNPPAQSSATAATADGLADAFQELADFAAGEALKRQSGHGNLDMDALRARLEACLAEVGRLAATAPSRPPDAGQAT